ncbi:glycoside hydrolase family 3 protein [Gordonia sp. PDNC005]|uniref:glycoside hydrolase family 3 N-terminal domain-containing protein n=1 Tax=unclassified Gordonia (in: high G+C Gram-positive bacteria) TaxID=2657482 RepID=UPI001964BE8B|nr:glycoside hydrolase family 3 N-terminal domain-containing protein [Gordonia sp. PDNC005]QRY62579.1 glycoside hydrolase family 3 protein [Gordonia sp. PDNC005]
MRGSRSLVAVLTAASLLAVAACSDSPDDVASSSSSTTTTKQASSTSAGPKSCGSDQLASLTLRERLAQLLVVGVADAADARQVVEREHLGGIFIGSWTDMSMLSDGSAKKLSDAQEVPLMVTVDQEGGRVSRLAKLGIDMPSPRELAKTKTPEEVRALTKAAGKKMKALGITVDFAPSVDVSDEPDDEVIGDRSFSNDPAVVTKYARAYAQGLLDAGIMPVYKHFPGHGHGSGDSHTGTVRTPPLSELITSDLVPYKTLLKNPGNVGVMVGHLIVPGLTGPDTPSSISPATIGMLRKGSRYGGVPFDGVVFSDDLSGMKAISDKFPIDVAVRKAINAGSDVGLWLSTDKVSAVLDSLEKAVESKKLNRKRIDTSVLRILKAKGVITCN